MISNYKLNAISYKGGALVEANSKIMLQALKIIEVHAKFINNDDKQVNG